jgi:hypothetical protein
MGQGEIMGIMGQRHNQGIIGNNGTGTYLQTDLKGKVYKSVTKDMEVKCQEQRE